jgi:hypothetical protein
MLCHVGRKLCLQLGELLAHSLENLTLLLTNHFRLKLRDIIVKLLLGRTPSISRRDCGDTVIVYQRLIGIEAGTSQRES